MVEKRSLWNSRKRKRKKEGKDCFEVKMRGEKRDRVPLGWTSKERCVKMGGPIQRSKGEGDGRRYAAEGAEEKKQGEKQK